jgi:hypothetical protein
MGKGSEYSLGEDEPTPVKPKTEGIKVETPKPETVEAPKPVVETAVPQTPGAFVSSLKRTNSQIKAARATMIGINAETNFRRKIEDIDLNINSMKMELENMLDMSPTNSQSLVLAADFDAEKFTQQYVDLKVKIRNAEITRDLAKESYNYLFVG